MRILFHVTPQHLASDGEVAGLFYRNLWADFAAAGFRVAAVRRDLSDLSGLEDPGQFHFVHNGRVQHPRVLNTGYGYLGGYWYADPKGVFADSSISDQIFDPAKVRYKPASAFFSRMVRKLVQPRHSRYNQPMDVRQFPAGAIAVFLQGTSDPVDRARHVGASAMVEAVLAHRKGRPVIVKPHPGNQDAETGQIIARLRAEAPEVIVTDANIHDILAAAAVTVSICSAACLEGMLHRKPAVLFGRTDFHHCAQTVQRPGDWPGALERALCQPVPYRKYLYWFFEQNLIDAKGASRFDRILARIERQGGGSSAP